MQEEKDELSFYKDELYKAKSIVVDSLVKDGKGFFEKDALEQLDIESLNFLRSKFNDVTLSEYEYILEHRRQRERDQKPANASTMGVYDQATGKWIGGLPQDPEV